MQQTSLILGQNRTKEQPIQEQQEMQKQTKGYTTQ